MMLWWQIALLIFGFVIVGVLIGILLRYTSSRITKRIPSIGHEKRVTEPEQTNHISPELFEEIEGNLSITSKPWAGDLLPLRTKVWKTSKSNINSLTAAIQQDLLQAYANIETANSIVWLAVDLGRRNENLDNHYRILCGEIKARLSRVISSLRESVPVGNTR